LEIKKSKLAEHFTLNMVEPLLSNYQLPSSSFESTKNWSNSYNIYNLRLPISLAGKLNISRKNLSSEKVALRINYERYGIGGAKQTTKASISCKNDTLLTPLNWQLDFECFDAESKRQKNIKLEYRAVVKDNRIIISEKTGLCRQLTVEPPYTINWSLFDVVQRLPIENFKPIMFTMLDHFEQIKLQQRLSYRETLAVEFNGTETVLHAYEQTGRGIVPWVYWLDKNARLVFVISGIEGYLLES